MKKKSVAKLHREDEKIHKKIHSFDEKEEKLHEREEKLHKMAESAEKKGKKHNSKHSSKKHSPKKHHSKAVSKAMKHADVPGAGAKKRKHLSPKNKIRTVMSEFKRGTLHSGHSKASVKNPKQAVAIALSEARKAGAHIPKKKKKSRKSHAIIV